MDCNFIGEKIIDYIDGNLSKEDKEKVKCHLEKCPQCNKEYNEIKLTIEKLSEKRNMINTNKEINLKLKKSEIKPIRSIRRTILIAVILTFTLVMTAIAADNFDFLKSWKKQSEVTITAWEKLLDAGVGQKLDISVIDNDIKVTAEGVIADELNTVIFIKVENLKDNLRLSPLVFANQDHDPIKIGGDIENIYTKNNTLTPERQESSSMVAFSSLYTEDENSTRFMINTDTLIGEEGNIDINISNLYTMFNKDEESILDIEGDWNLKIPAKKIKSKSYYPNESIEFHGNKVVIDKITIAPTATNINYRIKNYNEEKKYYINQVRFSIKNKLKKYKYSSLYSKSSLSQNNGYLTTNAGLESLYLEDPKKISLIIDSFEYTTKNREVYDIDVDKLPQTIEYNGNELIIEDIIYNKANTEVILREDSRRNRKYNDSSLEITAKDKAKDLVRMYTEILDFEYRNSKGKVPKELDYYVRSISKLKRLVLKNRDEEPNNDKIIPEKLIIHGQEYTMYPNKKIKIKLK
ncbi:DUF4179 domain-containing protein [Tissierella pigra]|uniref:Anti-sigma-W factor RsiW n=1 Tax=Tissierella pigra TaxID=2607614 RepID=A0A6N7XYH7_9FIRM|nr:DUF4179 domain-containing protein [Tissierella pigra]MBU5425610.1 DUF4179 domain-containing protein [Tissierella pigra]MSU00840.1 DUF4179 domain-containing protein [Tissierella pigra]